MGDGIVKPANPSLPPIREQAVTSSRRCAIVTVTVSGEAQGRAPRACCYCSFVMHQRGIRWRANQCES